MFSIYEQRLLAASSSEFPLIQAAAAALRRSACPRCRHGVMNAHVMLRTAVTKYKNDKRFKAHCETLFKLPCTIAGVLIER